MVYQINERNASARLNKLSGKPPKNGNLVFLNSRTGNEYNELLDYAPEVTAADEERKADKT